MRHGIAIVTIKIRDALLKALQKRFPDHAAGFDINARGHVSWIGPVQLPESDPVLSSMSNFCAGYSACYEDVAMDELNVTCIE